jgi:hypothetical protein
MKSEYRNTWAYGMRVNGETNRQKLTFLISVFVINATRNYMRFLHFHMSQDYLENLDSDSYDAYLAVQATQLFDLNQDSGRLGVLRNLIGIVQYRLGGSNEEDTE